MSRTICGRRSARCRSPHRSWKSVLDGRLSDPQVSLAVSTLKRNVKQMEELVAMVLKENTVESGGTEKLVRRTFDLWPHVEAVFRNLAPVAGTNSTELVNEVPPELTVFADAGMLSRILAESGGERDPLRAAGPGRRRRASPWMRMARSNAV